MPGRHSTDLRYPTTDYAGQMSRLLCRCMLRDQAFPPTTSSESAAASATCALLCCLSRDPSLGGEELRQALHQDVGRATRLRLDAFTEFTGGVQPSNHPSR